MNFKAIMDVVFIVIPFNFYRDILFNGKMIVMSF